MMMMASWGGGALGNRGNGWDGGAGAEKHKRKRKKEEGKREERGEAGRASLDWEILKRVTMVFLVPRELHL